MGSNPSEVTKKNKMFGLQKGDIINTLNKEGYKEFPITKFYTDENKNTWASLGELTKFNMNDGYIGEREWLIAVNNESCWEKSKWKVVSGY